MFLTARLAPEFVAPSMAKAGLIAAASSSHYLTSHYLI
jgi:hypothetical protein